MGREEGREGGLGGIKEVGEVSTQEGYCENDEREGEQTRKKERMEGREEFFKGGVKKHKGKDGGSKEVKMEGSKEGI